MNAGRRQRASEIMWLIAIGIVVAFVFAPGLFAAWGRDDYMQLAFVRLLDSPWPLFTQDHFFPAPGSIFRPLGFASMWLCQRLFGSDYARHAGFDLTLHVAVAFALFAVLRAVATPRGLAVLATIAFAVHPVAIGTALWWSARFDVLATLFVLLALRGAIAYRAKPRTSVLAITLLMLMAAMLSKEIGVVAALPISWIFVRGWWSKPSQRHRAQRALVAVWTCVAIYFAWRWCVIGTTSSGIFGNTPMADTLGNGVFAWLRQMPGYLGFGARLDHWQRLCLLAACSLTALAALRIMVVRSSRLLRAHCAEATRDAFVIGMLLLVIPAIVQAPIAALNAVPLDATISAVGAAMQSRLYYLGCAGVAMMIAAVLTPLWQVSWMRMAGCAAMLIIVVVLAGVSRDTAQAFATRSVEISKPARAVVAAIDALDLPPAPCHVVVSGVEPAAEWGNYVSIDSIVKALSPQRDRVGRCFFHSDYPTWFYFIVGDVRAADAAPYTPLRIADRDVPWLHFDGETIAYLSAPVDANSAAFANWKFLAWRGDRFEDVSADVAAGRMPVSLK